MVNLVSAGADVTVTLPASDNAEVVVKIAGAANGYVVTVDADGSETIDGATTKLWIQIMKVWMSSLTALIGGG